MLVVGAGLRGVVVGSPATHDLTHSLEVFFLYNVVSTACDAPQGEDQSH